MLRSLYSGVSGLSANLLDLDVIGNNIANSNTIGYKVSRVNFQETLTQTLRAASRPSSGGRGGTNPVQIGLGTLVGNVDVDFRQGDLRSTGMKTDLAIQGQGFFIMSDGTSQYYTRAGAFGLDRDYFLVNPGNGLRLQGRMADADGVIQPGALEDLYIDPTVVVPARASESLQLYGNLNADSDAQGSLLQSPSFLARAGQGDDLGSLRGQNGVSLGLQRNDTITVSAGIDGVSFTAGPFVVGTTGSTYAELAGWLTSQFQGAGHTGIVFAVDGATGALTVNNGSGATVTNLQLRSPGHAAFDQQFRFDAQIAPGADSRSLETRRPAAAADRLTDLYNSNGQALGLVAGSSTLQIAGTLNAQGITPHSLDVGASTTMGDLLAALGIAFNITGEPVSIDGEGRILVQGDTGLANAIGDVVISEAGVTNSALSSASLFTQLRMARDAGSFAVAATAHDSLGGLHTVRFVFQKIAGLNEWTWQAEMEGGETLLSGGSGRVRFTSEGLLSGWTFNDGSSALSFLPQAADAEGALPVTLNIEVGQIGGANGLSQFVASSSLQALADGYTRGELVDFEIDRYGIISGRFSNDTIRALGQVALATFSNPAGLLRDAMNTYRTTGNSGDPLVVYADRASGVSLAPGTLESSNVDLAEQFTRLVIAQRAFQANARVITTGDQILQEMVSLLR